MVLRTPLYDSHKALGATFTEFAGYDMPVHYGSIKDEHQCVRERVGLFDVSHMSNLVATGPGTAAAISRVTPSNAGVVPEGKGKYTVMLRDDGTILDDLFYFHLPGGRYFLIPNAGMNEAAADHLRGHAEGLEVEVKDESRDWAILALQGPAARAVLKAASDDAPPKFHHIAEMEIAGATCWVSGSGYTGEKGVELYVPADAAPMVWDALLAAGEEHGIRPIGLGARDTLRLEKGYCLAGHEFEGGRTPLEAGLSWLVDWEIQFLGRDALARQKQAGHDRLVGLRLQKGVPRQGYRVLRDGAAIGIVTSGTQSPTLGHGIALAYVRGDLEGDEVEVEIRARTWPAQIVTPPFV